MIHLHGLLECEFERTGIYNLWSDKRKRKVLTIDEKLEIVSLFNNNHSLAAIASKYGIGKSTVSGETDSSCLTSRNKP